ncbi:XRE family transcriptional regulator [Lysinibacillus fusiformis]|uniref:XRE family transcriptional regulator n=1 Tax=Lysinibacillus fusiformis TaxID=28031 RepID=UPI00215AA9DA|nr:XRE family transcriptional regulator [Lysinibacillus fusiformis]MCR8852867.1 XRE family transcriptional regulator [Lysinibacillus fusiformis]
MKTNDIVVKKVRNWLKSERKSYLWLANQLGIKKSLVEIMLDGERVLKPVHIEHLAKIMDISIKDLLKLDVEKKENLTVNLFGELTNRRSRRELDSLLFTIKDYINLKEQMTYLKNNNTD